MAYGSLAANINDSGGLVSSISPVGGPYRNDTSANSALYSNGEVLTFQFDNKYDITRINCFTLTQMYRNGQAYR